MTGDLISRDAAIDTMNDLMDMNRANIGQVVGAAMDLLCDIPAVDAVPLKHGKWELDPDFFECLHIHMCSYCKERPLYKQNNEFLSNYCPHCGAKMDGGKNGAD